MPSEAPILPTQPEKPHHYTYLKEFRTQQCPLFLQHKCTQHRPFTCFHWHFQNQRRRRPIRKRDGTFSYNPDIYCTKYDETTGMCPDGDECGFLHRTAGDTERRYHLRYYKTGTCVHETDSKGHCVKNGAHCAFAHGIHDLRAPVYDIRELKSMSEQTTPDEVSLVLPDTVPATQLEKDRIISEDPKWNDTNFVLANYKTELCKRPPRLCRQGYACPSYHNSRDRRRSPKKFKYRSTPCPNVKHGDEWGDPTQCEQGDNCPYCHTRTEQQFHPEIYKSTKCNDMVQTGYCPRGPFCAFAHVEQEMTSQRDVPTVPDNSLAAFVSSVLPEGESKPFINSEQKPDGTTCSFAANDGVSGDGKKQESLPLLNNGFSSNGFGSNGILGLRNQDSSFPEPIGKGRSGSIGSSNGGVERSRSLSGTGSTGGLESRTRSLSGASSSTGEYGKAPGSEREDIHSTLRKQIQSIENDMTIDNGEKSRRKQNLLLLHSLSIGSSTLTNSISQSTASSIMSPHAPSFYPPGDTVESVVGNALEEDLNLGELTLTALEREISKDNDNDTNSVCSSIGFPATSNSSYFGPASVPVTIPSAGVQRNSISSLSQSPSSPLGSLPHTTFAPHLPHQNKQDQQIEQVRNAAAAFLSQPNPGKFSAPGFGDFASSMSPGSNGTSFTGVMGNGVNGHNISSGSANGGALSNSLNSNGGMSQSPFGAGMFNLNGYNANANEMQRLKDELMMNKAKVAQWEDGISQARNACDAWKKEAEESNRKTKVAENDRTEAYRQRDEALNQVAKMKQEMEHLRGGPFLHCLQKVNELETLPITVLKQIQQQMRMDLETIEKTIYQHTAMKCMVCRDKNRSVAVLPCNHYVLCEVCANKRSDCPFCHTQIQQRTPVVLPM